MTSDAQYDYDIFLSHNHNDEEWAGQLAARLEQEEWQDRELRVFFSPWDIRPGQSIPKEIERALSKSRKVGLVMSPDAMGSAWVELERLVTTYIDISERQERLIPIYLRTCDTPPLLKSILPVDFRDATKFEESYKKLLAVIKNEPLPRGQYTSGPLAALPAAIPRPPVIGFVARRDKTGREIVELLKEELSPQKNQLVALWGAGGVGKTTLAAEAARSLIGVFADRIIWVSAEGRPDFSFSTLLDEVSTALGHAELRKLVVEAKKEEVRALIAAAETLIVLDNFETIAPDEQLACIDYLANKAPCPVLITTRQRINGARNIAIEAMSPAEAREFVARFIEQETRDQNAFAGLDRDHIIRTAEGNPLVLQWVIAQIDQAQEPQDVLDELAHGEGDAAQRVFDRSFNLPQVGNRGRDALLALSLFAPSASRPALAEVAGLGKDVRRLNKVIQPLASLWLLKTTEGNQRLMVEGLTRELARAHLVKHRRVKDFQRRFVTYFVLYAESNEKESAKDFDALEAEKDNIASAIDVAFEMQDWKRVMRLMESISGMLNTRGYWEEAIRLGELTIKSAHNALDEPSIARFENNLALIYRRRGEIVEAERLFNESLNIKEKLGNQMGIASALHNLGMLAQDRGEIAEAQRLYNESLEIKKKLGNQSGIASTLHSLGILAQDRGEIAEAQRLYNESLEINKKLGNQSGIANTLHSLGFLAQQQGEIAEAQRLYNESLEISKKLGNQSVIAATLHQLGTINLYKEEFQQAEEQLNQSLDILKKLGDKQNIAACLGSLGELRRAQGVYAEAAAFFEESLEMASALGDQFGIASVKHSLGILKEAEGDTLEAARLFREALTIFENLGSPETGEAREALQRVESGSG
jgi:tetratricopeptide (TPR) repeat protein